MLLQQLIQGTAEHPDIAARTPNNEYQQETATKKTKQRKTKIPTSYQRICPPSSFLATSTTRKRA
jgi:hypothetical protein